MATVRVPIDLTNGKGSGQEYYTESFPTNEGARPYSRWHLTAVASSARGEVTGICTVPSNVTVATLGLVKIATIYGGGSAKNLTGSFAMQSADEAPTNVTFVDSSALSVVNSTNLKVATFSFAGGITLVANDIFYFRMIRADETDATPIIIAGVWLECEVS